MRVRCFSFLLLLIFATGASRGAGPEIVRVWPSYRTASSFVRISEYFTGREAFGRHETIFRTDPATRAGFYFLTRIKNRSEEITGAQLQLEIITPDAPTPKIFRFPILVPHGNHVFQLGLTGKDWPNIDQKPVAWRILVLAPDGHALLSRQSFLWSKPDHS